MITVFIVSRRRIRKRTMVVEGAGDKKDDVVYGNKQTAEQLTHPSKYPYPLAKIWPKKNRPQKNVGMTNQM